MLRARPPIEIDRPTSKAGKLRLVTRMPPFAALDWPRLGEELDAHGCAVLRGLLVRERVRRARRAATPTTRCSAAASSWRRHGFGRGEYQYFAYPLPELVAALRTALYPPLAADRQPLERARWASTPAIRPSTRDFLARCHAAGQTRPTPLLLQYGAGDYNCLHQDLYGEHVFPLQVAILLSRARARFHRRRVRADRAAAAHAVARRGRAARPGRRAWSSPSTTGRSQGTRGVYRVNLRHGVSRVRSGRRHTLGVIFHDAK